MKSVTVLTRLETSAVARPLSRGYWNSRHSLLSPITQGLSTSLVKTLAS